MATPSHAVYVISVAAELAGVHPQTLRIYERKGLVDPARTAGGNKNAFSRRSFRPIFSSCGASRSRRRGSDMALSWPSYRQKSMPPTTTASLTRSIIAPGP